MALGDILVDQGVVDRDQLARAQAHAGADGSLARALVELQLASEHDLVRALAASLGMPYAEVDAGSVDPAAAAMLDPDEAVRLTALPVGFDADDRLLVAVADPHDPQLPEQLAAATGVPVALALAPRRALQAALDARGGQPPATVHPLRPEPSRPAPTGTHPAGLEPAADLDGPSEPAPTGAHGLGVPLPPAPPGAGVPAPASQPPAPPAAAPAPTSAPPAAPVVDGPPRLAAEETTEIDLDHLLTTLVTEGGSDLHLTAGIPPAIRVNGDVRMLTDLPACTPDELQKALYGIMTQKQRERFENELELDLSYSVHGVARFRVNVFQQRDSMGAVMRVIPFEILPLEQLGVPEQVANFAYEPRGFVLVTGPTGSGKSTTLASIIDLINRNRASHIMTVEDPIEFLHSHKRSVVNQREVGTDTHGFNEALKHVLRQDPDVILVGEMRDLETIQIALTAAETGHLVFGTLHTQDAPQTVDRVVDVFPPHQQEQIRVMLAGALKGVVCQTLLKTADGQGRAVACEVMTATSGVKNLIREGKTHQIYSAIQAGASHGMIAMDQSLATLVKSGKVSYDAALEKCSDATEFNRLVGR